MPKEGKNMHDLTVSTFTDKVIEELEKYHDGFAFTVNTVNKTNNVTLTGLTIREGEASICPTIYMDSYLREYEKGKEIEDIADDIWESYESCKNTSFELPDFSNYQSVAGRIRVKVLSTERNSEYLTGKVNMSFGDLSACFYIEVGEGTITITEEMAETWGRTAEDLLTVAMENAHEQSIYEIMDMRAVLSDMMHISPEEFDEQMPGSENVESMMYVVSNKTRVSGSGAILDLDLWKEFAKEHGNLYILPSSIHELIAVPDNGADDAVENLTAMVREVNSTQVAPEEVLSENVYYYDKEKNEISFAATKEAIVLYA